MLEVGSGRYLQRPNRVLKISMRSLILKTTDLLAFRLYPVLCLHHVKTASVSKAVNTI